jgi:diguanylate cyclase (GGDEF)-like protein/PAS domain S-box-containing protein
MMKPIAGDKDGGDSIPLLTLKADLASCRNEVAALTAALREAARTIDELIEDSPAVIHTKSLDGRFVHINKRFEEIVGVSRADVIGRTVFDVYPSAMAMIAHERDLDTIRSAKPITEETVVATDMSSRVFLDTKFPLFDANGAVRGTAGIAIEITEQKRLEEALINLANTDPLTGLPNRRCFFKNLAKEFDRSHRYARPLAVIGFDLDHFKAINDCHGHAGGDIVLKNIAELVLQSLRSTDMAGRIGGEEFAIFMPETESIMAAEVSERLRCTIANRTVLSPGGQPIQVTISVGVTSMRAEDGHPDEMLARADAALYKAKSEGRNRVCIDE